jgi:hypothetical protein
MYQFNLVVKETVHGFDLISPGACSNGNDACNQSCKTREDVLQHILDSSKKGIHYRVFASYEDYLNAMEKDKVSKGKDPTMSYMDKIRQDSGEVTLKDKLTCFLYVLMRDHVVPGKLEDILLKQVTGKEILYTNGWLAKYANYMAKRLTKQ